MTTEQRQQELEAVPVFLEPEEENQILNDLGQELTDEFMESLHDAFPDWIASPFSEAGDVKTLIVYLMNTRPEDVAMLRMPDYFKLWHSGLVPPLVSPFWGKLLMTGFEPFEEHRKEFLRLVREKILRELT